MSHPFIIRATRFVQTFYRDPGRMDFGHATRLRPVVERELTSRLHFELVTLADSNRSDDPIKKQTYHPPKIPAETEKLSDDDASAPL